MLRAEHRTVFVRCWAIGALAWSVLNVCKAQAWIPGSGQGDITISYQKIENEGHRLTDGTLIPHGQSVNTSAFLEADYGLTDRFSITIGVPYVWSRYTDSQPPPPPLVPNPLPSDLCRCWQSAWQDFGATLHYNAFRSADGTFSLTPSLSVGIPSHEYQFRGESAIGRDLRELTLAIDAGKRLDFLLPKLSVTGHYSYGVVERVLDIPNNRSNAAFEGRYALFRGRLTLRGFTMWQVTHGGLRTGSLSPSTTLPFPGEVNTDERRDQHDRLLRDNYFHAGAGASYSFVGMDVFASYIAYVNGTDTHAGNAVTAGVSWPFEWRYRKPSAK
jgi:hypothetical protein